MFERCFEVGLANYEGTAQSCILNHRVLTPSSKGFYLEHIVILTVKNTLKTFLW